MQNLVEQKTKHDCKLSRLHIIDSYYIYFGYDIGQDDMQKYHLFKVEKPFDYNGLFQKQSNPLTTNNQPPLGSNLKSKLETVIWSDAELYSD